MGVQKRKDKEREIRKSDIVEAAERLFFAQGYDHTTMDDVAKEAQFSKRTLYVYFNSKEEIYFEIMAKGYRLLIDALKKEKPKATDVYGEIRHMADVLYHFYLHHPDYFRAIMEYENGELDFQKGVSDGAKENCYALGEEVLGFLTDILQRGVKEGAVRGDIDVLQTALVFWTCIIGVFTTAQRKEQYIRHVHQTTADRLVSSAVDLLIRSIHS